MADVEIIPGIFEEEWPNIERHLSMLPHGIAVAHFDFADGTMISKTTPLDFDRYKALIAEHEGTSFEAHLMVANPEKYLRSLVDAGFTRLIIHIESNDPRRFFEQAKYEEVEVGIAIDGATELEEVEPFLEEIDVVAVLTKEAGADEGAFLPEGVEKVKRIREQFPDLPIEVVGGINETTVKSVKDAGATRIVATGYVFSHPDGVEAALEALADA